MLDSAQKQFGSYLSKTLQLAAATAKNEYKRAALSESNSHLLVLQLNQPMQTALPNKVLFLWKEPSSRRQKKLEDKECHNCSKIGHFQHVCQSPI